jgi:hypothetical protein
VADPAGRLGLGRLVRLLGERARPEVGWVAEVAGCPVTEARRAVGDVSKHSASVATLSASIRETGRSYYAQFPAPIELFALVRLAKPATLAESGVASGVSSAFMLMGTKTNRRGMLHSIDFPVARAKKRGNESWAIPRGFSSGWAVPSELKRGWDLREGRSEDLLVPLLEELGTLDFYCHDSPVDLEHFEFEMKSVRGHLKSGSVVVSDNTSRRIFDDTAKSVGARALYRRGSSLGAFRMP